MLNVIAILISLVALIPLLAYLLHWKFYSPKPFIRVSGEQSGDPIHIPEKGNILFAVSTKSDRKSVLSEVWVNFNPDEVDLSKTKGAEKRVTVDNRFPNEFPLAILFPEKRIIVKGHFRGNYFDYETKKTDFSVKFIINSQIQTTTLPFLLNMFPARTMQREWIVRFKVIQGYTANIPRYGLALLPKESLHLEGIQSQGAMHAATSKGIGSLKVIELIGDK